MTHCKFVLLLLGVAFCSLAQAGIYKYKNDKVSALDTYIRFALFDPEDAPSRTSPGNGRSFVKLDFEFNQVVNTETEEGTYSIYVLLFNSEEMGKIGIEGPDNTRHLCCSKEFLDQGKCDKLGSVNVTGSNDRDIWYRQIDFTFNRTGESLSRFVIGEQENITESGVYYLYFVNCPDSGVGEARMTGKAVFMNPYGYLPGDLFYYMPFYLSLCIVYFVCGLVWLGFSVKRWRQLLTLQNCIAGVILLGWIETATLYFDHLGYNIAGENYVGAMIVGVIISTWKKTISRLLVLIVCMGYGVVKPTLGAEKYKVLLLGALYFIFSAALNIVDLVQRTQPPSTTVVIFVIFPVAIFDTIFYWWAFLSLLRTIQQLIVRKQTVKLAMYKQFFATLIVAGILSSIMILAQLFVSISYEADELWKTAWIWNAFWHVLYLLILIAIAWLWRPTQNNTRYAYSEMPVAEEEEISLQPLPTIADMIQRRGGREDESEAAPINVVTLDSPKFALDDEEEDKGSKME